ncbi:MAG: CARDB domain-containing protein, partial [Longimicrobiales bacterium]
TTKNQGGGGAGTSTTRFYLSANGTIDASDAVLGSRSVPLLAAGASDSPNTTLTLPATTAVGTYYVIAQADSASAVLETTETNNTRASSTVKVGPDLAVSTMLVPSTATAGGTITVTDTTKNQGAGTAAASSTGFYLSVNTAVDATDVFLGSRPVGQLAFNGTSTASTPLQIPAGTAPGSYYVVGRADWNATVEETFETNNDRHNAIKIGGDLVVLTVSISAAGMPSGPVTVTDTTKNQGAAPVPESSTAFYLSLNSIYDSTDVFLGSRGVASLGPSATDTKSTEFIVPPGTATGSYYVLGIADSYGAVAESTETNNVRTGGTVRIGPDLVVTALTAPSSGVAGSSISASDTTKNQGGDTAPASVTRFYLSINSSLDAADVLLATRAVSSLGAGASEAGSASLPIPLSTTAGTYYIIANADGDGAIVEALENNNGRIRSISIAAAP